MRLGFLAIVLFVTAVVTSCTAEKKSDVAYTMDIPTTESEAPPKIRRQKWQPADFKGIRVGADSRSEAVRVLGTPDSTIESDDNDLPEGMESDELLDTYRNLDTFAEVIVTSSRRSNIVLEISAIPRSLSKSDAVKLFGENFTLTRYDFLECPGDAGSSVLYESSDGVLSYLEYRTKGIALRLDGPGTKVEEIRFISQPIGKVDPKCP